jgi:FtsH-binding integral membrane protein
LFAITLLVAGIFSTDPVLGYPPGAPEVQTTHGAIHGVAGLLAFTLLGATCFVMAWHFASQPGEARWTVYSIIAGLVVLVFFFAAAFSAQADMSGTWPNAPTGIFQRIAILAGFTWISIVAWHLVRKEAVG